MTDARFPERWLNDRRVLRLPDDAFRLFVLSLAWSVANQTDGHIYDDDLALIPASPAGSGQLAKSGPWERVADYWLIVVFEDTQTTRADLEHLAAQRRKARDRKRRERARTARPVTRDVTRDVPEDSTRTGQDRTGTEGNGHKSTSSEAARSLANARWRGAGAVRSAHVVMERAAELPDDVRALVHQATAPAGGESDGDGPR